MADNVVRDLFYTSDEFRSEDQDIRLGEIDAVFDFIRGIAEIERDSDCAGFENAEINGQPVHAVHQKDRDLVALDDAARDQEIGDAVCFFIKNAPGDLRAERDLIPGLNQFVFFPCSESGNADLGIQLNESDIIGVFPCIFFQKICDDH